MSIITRGLGSCPKVITMGFGTPCVDEAAADSTPFFAGRRSNLYEKLAENIYIKKYKTTATLKSVNGIEIENRRKTITEIQDDERESFKVTLNEENIKVVKTNPKQGIFINIIKIIKR